MKNLKLKGILFCSLLAVSVTTIFLSSCEKKNYSKSDQIELLEETTNSEQLQTRNNNCNNNCLDWDEHSEIISNHGGVTASWYAGEVGWNRYAWHTKYQYHNQGFSCGFGDDDHRFYYTDPYFSNPDNKHKIRVRDNYNNCSTRCKNSTPIFDYLKVTGSESCIGSVGTKYLRLTLGERCNSCINGIVLVAK